MEQRRVMSAEEKAEIKRKAKVVKRKKYLEESERLRHLAKMLYECVYLLPTLDINSNMAVWTREYMEQLGNTFEQKSLEYYGTQRDHLRDSANWARKNARTPDEKLVEIRAKWAQDRYESREKLRKEIKSALKA